MAEQTETCPNCEGKGWIDFDVPCPRCATTGYAPASTTPPETQTDCPLCMGSGEVRTGTDSVGRAVYNACPACLRRKLAAAEKRVAELEGALREISAKGLECIYSHSQDYRDGSHAAFGRSAEIADAALSRPAQNGEDTRK
jgi:RecJ-like exonuclease